MSITRYKRQIVLLCCCCDPDVVFWNWTAFFTEQIFNLAVLLGSRGIANQDSICRCELIDCLKVRFHTVGFARAVIQLSQDDAGNEDISRFGKTLMNRGIFGKDRDNDIRIEEKATTH